MANINKNIYKIVSGLIDINQAQNKKLSNLSGVISGLNYDSVGGSGKFIQSISQDKGLISATAADLTAAAVSRTATAGISSVTVQNALAELDEKISGVVAKAVSVAGTSAITVTGASTQKTVALKLDGNDKYLTQSDDGLLANIGISSVTGSAQGQIAKTYFLTGKDGQKITGTEIDIPKDRAISGITYDQETKKLVVVVYTASGTTASTTINLSGLIDTYYGASGVQKIGSTFVGKVDGNSESYLTVNENGFNLSGIDAAITNAVSSKLSGLPSGHTNEIVIATEAGQVTNSSTTIGTSAFTPSTVTYNDYIVRFFKDGSQLSLTSTQTRNTSYDEWEDLDISNMNTVQVQPDNNPFSAGKGLLIYRDQSDPWFTMIAEAAAGTTFCTGGGPEWPFSSSYAYASTVADLTTLETTLSSFLVTDNLVYVISEKAFYKYSGPGSWSKETTVQVIQYYRHGYFKLDGVEYDVDWTNTTYLYSDMIDSLNKQSGITLDLKLVNVNDASDIVTAKFGYKQGGTVYSDTIVATEKGVVTYIEEADDQLEELAEIIEQMKQEI